MTIPSPGLDQTSEPIRVQRKQRQISVDSTDALPKAKAKVIIKKPKVQLPGHFQSISVPSVKPVDNPQKMMMTIMTLKLQVQMILQYLCLRPLRHHLRQVTSHNLIRIHQHKEHLNWFQLRMMMKNVLNDTKMKTLLCWLTKTSRNFQKKMLTLNRTIQTILILWMLMVLFLFQSDPNLLVFLILVHMMSVVSISLNSILLRMARTAKGRICYHPRSFEKVC